MSILHILGIVIATIILSFGSGTLYRMGGGNRFNTKFRDMGCAAVSVVEFFVFGFFHWSLILYFGALFGSLTTYWKKKGTDAQWYNWLFTGFFYALSAIVYPITTGHWQGFFIRLVFLPLAIMIWSVIEGRVEREEGGRGGLIIATQLLLLIQF